MQANCARLANPRHFGDKSIKIRNVLNDLVRKHNIKCVVFKRRAAAIGHQSQTVRIPPAFYEVRPSRLKILRLNLVPPRIPAVMQQPGNPIAPSASYV